MITIGVDIDGTIYAENARGRAYRKVAKLLKRWQHDGYKLVFITCRPMKDYESTFNQLKSTLGNENFTLICWDRSGEESWTWAEFNIKAVEFKKSNLLKYSCQLMLGNTAMVDGEAAHEAGIPYLDVMYII